MAKVLMRLIVSGMLTTMVKVMAKVLMRLTVSGMQTIMVKVMAKVSTEIAVVVGASMAAVSVDSVAVADVETTLMMIRLMTRVITMLIMMLNAMATVSG